MKKKLLRSLLLAAIPASVFVSCMDYGPHETETIGTNSRFGLFVVNEGNFAYGNASLSYYDPAAKTVENEVFIRVNGYPLGDVAQSMTIHDGKGFLAVNNSGVVFVIDVGTFACTGKIRGLTSPRYVHIVSEEKAYITDLHAYSIAVFNPQTLELTGRIPTDTEGRTQPSTEQMVQYGNYVFTNCWSYDNRILVIDTEIDRVVDEIEVGRQPTSLVIDKYDKIWTVTDGGHSDSPNGREPATLYKIDAATRQVERSWQFGVGESGSELCMDGSREHIYFLNKHVWRMDVLAGEIPEEPYIENPSPNYWYGLTVDPATDEVYIADAVDHVQRGTVYRYSPQGRLLDSFKVGIMPGAFCFKSGEGE